MPSLAAAGAQGLQVLIGYRWNVSRLAVGYFADENGDLAYKVESPDLASVV